MVWGKNRDQVELDEFGSGGPRYPGNGHTNHALLHGERKSHASVIRKAVWGGVIRMRRQKWFAFLVLGTLNVALLVGGAFAMKYFEAGPEQLRNEHYTQIAQRIDDFYRNCSKPNLPYSEIWNSSNCSNIYKEHRKYQQVEASLTINGDFGNKTRWTTSGSLLYSASVMSTIGYGYLFPVTVQGKIFTIAYACVAIPTTWGWMGFIGNLWIDLCRGLNRYTFVQCGIRNQKGGPKQRYTVLWMTLLVWAYVCAMGQVYMALPDKNDPSRRVPQGYLENVYFAFITFSTIGFGHYYIGDSSIGDTTLVLLTMFSGVAVLSGFIAIIWQTISKIVVKADYIIIHEHDDEDDDGMLVLHTADPDSEEARAYQHSYNVYE
eukprot:m.28409 g.28409  ORF g.28409 m.28409 type:complete len:376 (-) comp12015_c0_seq2:343-1470(-)